MNRIPSDIHPKKLLRALTWLGFVLNTKGGRGSHVKVIWRNEKSITVQYNLHRHAFLGLLKEIEEISGLTWEEIEREL